MKRFNHIYTLIESADGMLIEIEDLYNKSLAEKELDAQLLVRIKNFLENLRSALDYLAKEIFDRFCTQPANKRPIAVYFPILGKTPNASDFKPFMKGRFPGLQQSCPSIYSKLESYQFYKSASNEWLVQFNELCKENKHEQLSPQTREQEEEIRLTDPSGRQIGWNEGIRFGPGKQIVFEPGGKLTFGPGGSIEFGDEGVSVMGRPVDTETQVPSTRPGDKAEKIVWVNFVFTAIDAPALPFLKLCAKRVRAIVDEVKGKLEKGSR